MKQRVALLVLALSVLMVLCGCVNGGAFLTQKVRVRAGLRRSTVSLLGVVPLWQSEMPAEEAAEL